MIARPLRSAALFAACSLPLTLTAAASADDSPQTTMLGYSVMSPAVADLDFQLRPGNAEPGMTVFLLTTVKAGAIIDLDRDASTIAKAVDSAGNDLLEKPRKRSNDGFSMSGMDGPIGMFPSISEDGRMVTYDLRLPTTPAAEASSVTVEGTIVLKVAEGREKKATKPMDLKADVVVKAGPVSMTVKSVEPGSFDPDEVELTFETTKESLEAVATLTITDDSGEMVAERRSMMAFNNDVTVTYALPRKPSGKATVSVEHYTKLRAVKVPLKMTIGMGGEKATKAK